MYSGQEKHMLLREQRENLTVQTTIRVLLLFVVFFLIQCLQRLSITTDFSCNT